MNRTIALFLTVAILAAHTLAIHKNMWGEVAPPYDTVHAAYRLARNLVQTGTLEWNVGSGGIESYPSLLWIGLAAFAERFYLPVTLVTQIMGAVSATLAVIVLAQFSPGRLAGVIAPCLFVVSGIMASAAGNGTEMATFALLLTTSFLAFERRSPAIMAFCMALACLTRPEGILFVAVLFALEIARGLWPDRVDDDEEPTDEQPKQRLGTVLPAFLLPLIVTLGIGSVRFSLTGRIMSPWMDRLLFPDPNQWHEGLLYLRDFFFTTGGALLIVFPVWYLLRNALSGLGVRALILSAFWAAIVGFGGGDSLPFFQAMAPILAILFVAVQEGMQTALDSRRAGVPQLAWILFLLGMGTSALASKYPGDLGPLPTGDLQKRWMTATTTPRFGYQPSLGRLSIAEEIETTERLRSIGIFLREQIDPSHSVLTPWPGAIGYLARVKVLDVLGRTSPAPGAHGSRSWNGYPRADVVAALAEQPDYIVPQIHFEPQAPTIQYIAEQWAKTLDHLPDKRRRSVGIFHQLRTYELITVPIERQFTRTGLFPRNRFFLMRRKNLDLAPRLQIEVTGDEFVISVEHRSHTQLADLRVQLLGPEGNLWSLRPTGEFENTPGLLARSSILLFSTGARSIELVRGTLPEDLQGTELRAVLRNPGAVGELIFSPASDEVRAEL